MPLINISRVEAKNQMLLFSLQLAEALTDAVDHFFGALGTNTINNIIVGGKFHCIIAVGVKTNHSAVEKIIHRPVKKGRAKPNTPYRFNAV